MADLIQQVKALDPIPGAELPVGLWTADAVLHDIDERTETMQTRERPINRAIPPPSKPVRRPVWALAAAFVAVVAAGVLFAIMSGSGDDVATGPQSEARVDSFAGTTLTAGTLSAAALYVDFPPFLTEESTGFDFELMDELGRRLALPVTYEPFPYHDNVGLTPALSSVGTEWDLYVGAATIADERADLVAFTAPYFKSRFAMIVNQARTPDITGIDALTSDHRVNYSGGPSDEWVATHLTSAGVQHGLGFWSALESGLLDAYFTEEANARAWIDSHPDLADLTIVEVFDEGATYGIAVDRNNPELLAALNGALQEMIDDGTYRAIYDRWFDDPYGSVAP